MNNLAGKTGHKILLSDNKTMLERYWAVILGGRGRDWWKVHTFSALLSKQSLKHLVRQWGNNRWQAKWAGLFICQQTKVWFPFIRGNFIPQIRRLNRYDLGHLIHFTTGHNFLLRHGCKLTGGAQICAGSVGVLWRMPFTSGRPAWPHNLWGIGGDSTTGPISWSPTQLCRFLRVPLIALLMDQDGVEHPGGLTPNGGVGP